MTRTRLARERRADNAAYYAALKALPDNTELQARRSFGVCPGCGSTMTYGSGVVKVQGRWRCSGCAPEPKLACSVCGQEATAGLAGFPCCDFCWGVGYFLNFDLRALVDSLYPQAWVKPRGFK